MKIFRSWADAALFDDPAGGTGGGGTPAAGAAGATPAATGATDPAAAAAAAAGNPAPAASPGQPAPAAPYRPEGLADNLFGQSDRETIDNLQKALKGYRDRDSGAPEKPEAYKAFGDVDAPIKPFVDQLTTDPLFDRMTQFAKEQNIPLAQFQGLTKQYLALAAEMGILEPPIDVAKERQLLTPENARHLPEAEQAQARNKRLTDNLAWLDQQVAPEGQQGLSKEAADFAKMMLGDRAVGHQFIEFMRARTAGGGGPLMQPGPTAVSDARKALADRMAAPEMQRGHPKFDKQAYDALVADYQRVIPD